MKRIVVLSMPVLFIFCVATGQPNNTDNESNIITKKESKAERVALRKSGSKDVSITSKNAFIEDFTNITNVLWNRSENFDEASFTSADGKKLTAFYGEDGHLVGTTQNVAFSEVPLKGQQEIKNKYKDYKTGNVVFFDDNEANESDMILWASQFDDDENYFVELKNGQDRIIVKVDTNGALSFFKKLN